MGNLCGGSARFCARFNASDALGRHARALLLRRSDGGGAVRETTAGGGGGGDAHARRAVAALSGAQLGTRTWRRLERL